VSLAAVSLWAADLPKLTYSKSFPGSQPAYLAISVDREGNSTYQEAPDDDNPAGLQTLSSETEALFAKSEKLGRFTRPLESGLRSRAWATRPSVTRAAPRSTRVKFQLLFGPRRPGAANWFEIVAESSSTSSLSSVP